MTLEESNKIIDAAILKWSEKILNELKDERRPIVWGKYQRFKNYVDDLNLDLIDSKYPKEYGDNIRQFIKELSEAEFIPFVDKKAKKLNK